jgi:hypothetical protein
MTMTPELVDMKKAPAKMGDEMPNAMSGEVEDYPYGLCIRLEKEQLDALNLMELPEVGKACKILATGVVTQSSMQPGGKDPGVSIQITALQLIQDGEEKEESESDDGNPGGKKANTILGNGYRGNY